MLRLLVTLVSVISVSACASPDKGLGETGEVHRSDLGSEWPLTVDSALLACNEGVVSVQVEARTDVIDRTTGTRSVSSRFTEM